MSAIKVSPARVLELLEEGYTRTKSSKNYNPEIGSIEEYYQLSKTDVSKLFKHPDLKGKKTKIPTTEFEFVEDPSMDEGGMNNDESTVTNEATDDYQDTELEAQMEAQDENQERIPETTY